MRIKSIFGCEPAREGEYPIAFAVGGKPTHTENFSEVTEIVLRENYRGDHSIIFYDVYADNQIIVSLNERYVAEIYYFKEEE